MVYFTYLKVVETVVANRPKFDEKNFERKFWREKQIFALFPPSLTPPLPC
jgi:hypothetical protein